MKELIENGYLVVAGLACIAVVGVVVQKFYKLPTKEQINSLKEWLLYAVIEAEKELGGKTGELKLAKVYDMAIARYPFLSVISYSLFKKWVDIALDKMKKIFSENEKIRNYIKGE